MINTCNHWIIMDFVDVYKKYSIDSESVLPCSTDPLALPFVTPTPTHKKRIRRYERN